MPLGQISKQERRVLGYEHVKLVGLPSFSVLRNAKVQMVEKIGGIEPFAFFARPMACMRVMDTPNIIVW